LGAGMDSSGLFHTHGQVLPQRGLAFAHQSPALQSRSRAAQLGGGAIITVMAPIAAL
jgi:hypothetical protein